MIHSECRAQPSKVQYCHCRPSQHQRQAYNGYKKYHSLKFQAVVIPNGLFAHLFGPVEGRRADGALLEESHLIELCRQYAIHPGTEQNPQHFVIYGDPAYGVYNVLVSPFTNPSVEEQRWNTNLSQVRIEVEHAFGRVVKKWPFLNSFYKHEIYSSPVGRYYRVGVLLTNAHNCFQQNQVSHAFALRPLSIFQYFHD